MSQQQTITLKMADQERSDLYCCYQDSLRASATKTLITFSIRSCTSLKSSTETYESSLKVTGEFEFHTLPNKKVRKELW